MRRSPALFTLLFGCLEKPPRDFGTGIFVLVARELARLHVPVEVDKLVPIDPACISRTTVDPGKARSKRMKKGSNDGSRDDRENNPDKHDVEVPFAPTLVERAIATLTPVKLRRSFPASRCQHAFRNWSTLSTRTILPLTSTPAGTSAANARERASGASPSLPARILFR